MAAPSLTTHAQPCGTPRGAWSRLFFAVVAAACSLSACAETMSDEQLRKHLEQQFQERYIDPYVRGDTKGWLSVFAEDAVALHDDLPALEGRESIQRFAEAVSANFTIEKLDAVVDEVRRQGQWAWTRGHFDALFTAKSEHAPQGVAGPRQGKFLLIWERQDSGEWRVILDMGNGLAEAEGQ